MLGDPAASPDYQGSASGYLASNYQRFGPVPQRGGSIPPRNRDAGYQREHSYQKMDSSSQLGANHFYNMHQSPYADRSPLKAIDLDHHSNRGSGFIMQSGGGYGRLPGPSGDGMGHSRGHTSTSPSPHVTNPLTDIGASKSYIMAMKTLQVKLEEKDRRIKELEEVVNMFQDQQENNPHAANNAGPRHTATFGGPESGHFGAFGGISGAGTTRNGPASIQGSNLKSGLQVRVPGLHLAHSNTRQAQSGGDLRGDKQVLEGRNGCYQGQRGHQTSVEADELHRGATGQQTTGDNSYLNLSTSCSRCIDTDHKISKMEELQRELDLTKKKLAMQKEQNSLIQENLETSNTQLGMLESQVSKKDKELKSLQSALQNMKELVEIISKKRRDCSVLSSSSIHDSSTHYSGQDHHGNSVSPSSSKHLTEAGCGTSSETRSRRSRSAFEEIFGDIVTYVTLNPELSFEEIDLFYHMRQRLSEQSTAFATIRANADFLLQTRTLLLEKASESRSGGKRGLQDVRTLDSLLGFSKAILALQDPSN